MLQQKNPKQTKPKTNKKTHIPQKILFGSVIFMKRNPAEE